MSNGKKHGTGSPTPPAPTGPVMTKKQQQDLVIYEALLEVIKDPAFGPNVIEHLNKRSTSGPLNFEQTTVLGKLSAEMNADPAFATLALAKLSAPRAPLPTPPAPATPAATATGGGSPAPTGSSGGSGTTTAASATTATPSGPTLVNFTKKSLVFSVLGLIALTIGLTIIVMKMVWPKTVQYVQEIPARLLHIEQQLQAERSGRESDRQQHARALAEAQRSHEERVKELSDRVTDQMRTIDRLTINTNVVSVQAAERQRALAIQDRDAALARVASMTVTHAQAVAALESRLAAEVATVTSRMDAAVASRDRTIFDLRRENELLSNRAGGARIGEKVTLAVVCPNMPTGEQFEVLLERVGQEPIRFTVTAETNNRGDRLDVQRVIEVPADTYTVSRIQNGTRLGQPFPTDLRPGPRTRWVRIQNEAADDGSPLWREITLNQPFLTFWNGQVQCMRTEPNGTILPYDRPMTVSAR